jgi:transcriptional regulator with GAF, ATPase, and Fis domain
MKEVFALARTFSTGRRPVVIWGETGTGKELVARVIHESGPRASRRMISVNAATLAEGIADSELFGHRRGAYTGAVADQPGIFRAAHGSTLLIDEITETSLVLQAKLLRVLEESQVLPLGSSIPIRVDVRVLVTTNRCLQEEVRAGRFREDLLFRLDVLSLWVPPLRERREEIPGLAAHFVTEACLEEEKPIAALTPEALAMLSSYSFPGNVRELRNEIHRAVVITPAGRALTPDRFSERMRRATGACALVPERGGDLERASQMVTRALIVSTLERTGGNKAQAARELGITYRGLVKMMRRLGLR